MASAHIDHPATQHKRSRKCNPRPPHTENRAAGHLSLSRNHDRIYKKSSRWASRWNSKTSPILKQGHVPLSGSARNPYCNSAFAVVSSTITLTLCFIALPPLSHFVFHHIHASHHRAIDFFRENPKDNVRALANSLGCSKRTAERLVAELRSTGTLKRIGNSKAGSWIVGN